MNPVYLWATILLMGSVLPIGAQTPPDTLWIRTYGGVAFDAGTAILQTADGGFIVAGSTESYGSGGTDAWLVKIDSGGTMEWGRAFGGVGDDHAGSIEQTADGGYIVAGLSKSFGNGSEDIWLLKTAANGDSLWDRIYGGPEDDRPQCVGVTLDGGYILAGGTGDWVTNNQDAWLIRTDASGNVIWDEKYGGSGNDKAYTVQQTTDGGFAFSGITSSFGSGAYDAWLVKTNQHGDSLWDRTFGGADFDNAYHMKQTTDGGYILAGYTQSYGSGGQDVWLIKTDQYGHEEWNEIFGESGNEVAYGVQQTTRGNYILAGLTNSFGAVNYDALLIKTDPDGNEIWKDTYGGSGNDHVFSVDQTDDGGYVATGYSNSFGGQQDDLYVVRLDSDEPSVPTVVGSFGSQWTGSCVEIDWFLTERTGQVSFEVYRRDSRGSSFSRIDGELISIGDMRFKFRDRSTQRGRSYTYRIEVIEEGGVTASFETSVTTPPLRISLGRNLPNPFSVSTRIDFTVDDNQVVTLEIYDTAGRLVRTLADRNMTPGEYVEYWNGRDSVGEAVASGVYFVRLAAGKETLTRKAILLR